MSRKDDKKREGDREVSEEAPNVRVFGPCVCKGMVGGYYRLLHVLRDGGDGCDRSWELLSEIYGEDFHGGWPTERETIYYFKGLARGSSDAAEANEGRGLGLHQDVAPVSFRQCNPGELESKRGRPVRKGRELIDESDGAAR